MTTTCLTYILFILLSIHLLSLVALIYFINKYNITKKAIELAQTYINTILNLPSPDFIESAKIQKKFIKQAGYQPKTNPEPINPPKGKKNV